MRCAKCKTENADGLKFCNECGAPFKTPCASCGFENALAAKFCGDCGAALRAVAGAASPKKCDQTQIRLIDAPASENLEGERKTVTGLFADIKGSTELIEGLDPEEARAIVDPALKLMIEAVHHYGGYVAQSTGDGIFALFGAPTAYEDHPQRGLLAALRMQQQLKRYSERTRAEGRLPIQVRVGVNTGEVVVRVLKTGEAHSEYVPVGHSISLAARMQALAPIGSIAATEQVRKLCEGYFAFAALGPTKVKGVSEPVNIYEVTGLGPLRTRLQRAAALGYTKFVGRQREIDTMKHAAELAKSGHGQIVAAVAEAGAGKSRLFHEFKATSQSGCLVLEALSFSYSKATAYLPLLDLLHSYFRIRSDDDRRIRREKVNGRILTLDPALEHTRPHLFALLGIAEGEAPLPEMDAQVQRRRTQEAVKRILLRESLNQPLMLIFEDLHWIDEETQAFLNVFAEGIANAPVLLLVNYRPEYSHAWGSKTYYTQLRLDPLGKNSAGEMLSALVGDSPELAPLIRLVLERTEGNPLFMEELIEALFEQGVLVRNGTVKVKRALNQLKIPPTVQGILAARIDRLSTDTKELLQSLAAIGMEFPLSLVCKVVRQQPEQIDRLLSELQTGEFIYEQPAAGDVEYRFKHALTHQAAYDALLTERRRLLHERSAEAIEALYSERLEDHYTELAHHYSRTTNVPKAILYQRLAGEQAARRLAHRQAAANLRSALELIKSLPDSPERSRDELDLLVMLGPALMATRGMATAEVRTVYLRARELCGVLDDDSQLFPVLWGLWSVFTMNLELAEGQKFADELTSLAEQSNDDAQKLEAHHAQWNSRWLRGELRAARADAERGIALYNPREHAALASRFGGHDAGVCARGSTGVLSWLLGYPDRALVMSNEAVSLGRQLEHPISLFGAISNSAIVCQSRGERENTAKHAQAMFDLFPNFADAVVLHGWANAAVSEHELSVMRKTVIAKIERFFHRIS